MSLLGRRLLATALTLPVALLGGAVWFIVGVTEFFACDETKCVGAPAAGDWVHNPDSAQWSQLEALSIAAGLAGLVVLTAVALRRRNLAIVAFAVLVGCAVGVFWRLASADELNEFGDSPAGTLALIAALVCGSVGIALTPRRR